MGRKTLDDRDPHSTVIKTSPLVALVAASLALGACGQPRAAEEKAAPGEEKVTTDIIAEQQHLICTHLLNLDSIIPLCYYQPTSAY